jgi:cytidylate kinase
MKLNDPFVITISREVGSGGGSVARKLAEKLNVNYINKQLMQALEERFNLTPAGIEHLKSTKKNWFKDLFEQVASSPKATIKVGGYTYSREFVEAVTVKDIYDAEVEILNAIADEGSCVIAGRSAFFVLKGRPNKVDIFITASKEGRIKRIMEKQGLSREDAVHVIKTGTDKLTMGLGFAAPEGSTINVNEGVFAMDAGVTYAQYSSILTIAPGVAFAGEGVFGAVNLSVNDVVVPDAATFTDKTATYPILTATSFSGTSANVTALLNTLNANEKSGSWRVRAVPTGNGAYTLTIAYSKSGFMIIFK